MSARAQVLIWAQRIVGRKGSPPHVLLEIEPDATLDDAQAAFHKIARQAHPDLHRTTLTAEELELVTTAYSQVAAAYQEFRAHKLQPARTRPKTTPPPGTPTFVSPAQGAAAQMNSKAIIYYRKAELALRRGDLAQAVLQLKMAIAADPQSTLLRTAMAEVMAEVGKKP